MESYIVDEIIRATGDEKSRPFWEKAVRILGEPAVHEEFSVTKMQRASNSSIDPKRYLTALLKKRMRALEAVKVKQVKLHTYFEENQITLFNNLSTMPAGGIAEKKEMQTPYGKDIIPWATLINSSFFTLSTNKAKADVVDAKFRTMDGEVLNVPMFRGRVKPGGKELGIPTVEHGRILAALESIWTQQGCQYHTYTDSSAVVCFCLVSIRELAKLLGRTTFGGRDLVQLTNKVWDLKTMAFYLDLAAVGVKNAVNRGFSLLHSVELAEGKRHGQIETVLRVEFSPQLSAQLINRHAVGRPKEIAHIQSELGFLLRLHIEAVLWKLNGIPYTISLLELIKEMSLPKSGWHGHRGKRRQIFETAIKSLGNQKTTDGRRILLMLEEGLTDWMLVAKLESLQPQIPQSV